MTNEKYFDHLAISEHTRVNYNMSKSSTGVWDKTYKRILPTFRWWCSQLRQGENKSDGSFAFQPLRGVMP